MCVRCFFCDSAVYFVQMMDINIFILLCAAASRQCISVVSGLSVWQLSHVGIKEVSQEALHVAPRRRDHHWIQSQFQGLGGPEGSRSSVGGVETLDGAGKPDESFETLDVSAAVVHELVFGHSSTTAGRRENRKLVRTSSVNNMEI